MASLKNEHKKVEKFMSGVISLIGIIVSSTIGSVFGAIILYYLGKISNGKLGIFFRNG